jgi:hypothetical protein
MDVVALLAGVAGQDPLALGAEHQEHLLPREVALLEAEFAQAAVDPDLVEVGLELEDPVEVFLGEKSQRDPQFSEVGTFLFQHVFVRVYPQRRADDRQTAVVRNCGKRSLWDGRNGPLTAGRRLI